MINIERRSRNWRAAFATMLFAACAAVPAQRTAASPAPTLQSPLLVIYPDIEERAAEDYGYRVLRLALDKAEVPYRLLRSATQMNQQRARLLLEQGAISIFETGTSAEFERRFDAVYFPVDRGLSGFRLLLIRQDHAGAFAAIANLAALRSRCAGQGPGWADNAILMAAGIDVRTAEFAALPLMLQARRIDFYPLGIEEIGTVLARNKSKAPDLIIEPHLALHYDFARLFFVRKGDTQLRDIVMLGLTRAFADGSLQQLLDADAGFRHALADAAIKRRTLIELPNPNLTADFRRIPRKYFQRFD